LSNRATHLGVVRVDRPTPPIRVAGTVGLREPGDGRFVDVQSSGIRKAGGDDDALLVARVSL
jgi:hypothetical protein